MNKNAEKLSSAIDMVDEKYLAEAAEYQPAGHKIRHTKLLIAAVIAAVSVLMMGAGFVAATGGITGWFSESWEMTTGETITEEHLELVDSFSQALGLSETYDDVTVTVDSAAVSEDRIYLLLKVNGEIGAISDYTLVSESIGFSACGLSPAGEDESGATYYLLECLYDYIGEEDNDKMQCTLTVNDVWSFEFALSRNDNSHVALTEEGETKTVTFGEDATVDVTDIVITEFGVSFTCDNTTASIPYETYSDLCEVHVVTNSGSEVGADFSIEELCDDDSTVTMNYYWTVPVNLDEVASIRIGDTVIEVG